LVLGLRIIAQHKPRYTTKLQVRKKSLTWSMTDSISQHF
jgi:hypothetical protein